MKQLHTIIALACAISWNCHAEIIAKYEGNLTANSTDSELNTTAGDISVGAGATAFGYSSISQANKSILFDNDGFNQTTRTGAISLDDYITFTVDVNSGYSLNMTNLTFYTLRRPTEGAGAPDSYGVFTSQDDFTRSVGTAVEGITVASSDTSSDFVQHTIDLSGFSELQSVTDSTEIRIYLWTTTGIATPDARKLRMDEFTLEGTVSGGVEEPDYLANYTFDDTAESEPGQTGASGSTFGSGAGITGFNYSSVSIDGKSAQFANSSFNQTTESGAVSADDYIHFTLSVSNDFRAALSNLTFYTLRRPTEGAGAPDSYAIYTSLDSYTSAITSEEGAITVADSDSSTTFVEHNVDLSALADIQAPTNSVEFRIYMWTTTGIAGPSERVFRLDDVVLGGTAASLIVPTGYEAFAAQYGLTGDEFDDADLDGKINLYEYGLGGNPTNGIDDCLTPVFVYGTDDTVSFTHSELTDPERGITYIVENNTDLINGTWTNSGWSLVSTNASEASGFEDIDHQFNAAGSSRQFFRLRITKP